MLSTRPGAARRRPATWAPGSRRRELICFTDDDCEPAPGLGPPVAPRRGAGRPRRAARSSPAGAHPAVLTASQAIVEHLTVSSLDPATGRRRGVRADLRPRGDSEALVASLPFDESFPSRGQRIATGASACGGRGMSPHSRRALSSSTARRLGRRRLRPPAVPLRARRGALPGTRRRAACQARPGFYTGLIRRGFDDGAAAGGLVVAAQALTAAGVSAARRFAPWSLRWPITPTATESAETR